MVVQKLSTEMLSSEVNFEDWLTEDNEVRQRSFKQQIFSSFNLLRCYKYRKQHEFGSPMASNLCKDSYLASVRIYTYSIL